MNCTKCGKVWCPGEATLCSACAGPGAAAAAAAVARAAGGDGAPPPLPSPDDFVGRMIPTGNKPSLIAYYASLAALIPFLGIAAGIIAVIFGVKGVNLARRYPEVRGGIHAWFGLIFGGLFTLVWIGAIFFLLVVSRR